MKGRASPLLLLAGMLFLAFPSAASAGAADFPQPRLVPHAVAWDAAQADIKPGVTFTQLNAATSVLFPGIADSSVPVLLPLNAETLAAPPDADLSGFKPTGFFLAGPAGYDAVFSLQPARAGIAFAHPVLVTISGFAFVYDLPAPKGRVELAPGPLAEGFPGLRRQILESTLRYSFTRYGASYVVSIQCYDARHTQRRLSCRNAERIADRFLQALQLAGGTKPAEQIAVSPPQIERPAEESRVFTYYPAGSLIPGSGLRGRGGVADRTVYARMRFPLAAAPAFANSQSFMNWGDCDQTGRTPRPRGKDAPYRCRVNLKPLVFNEGAPDNYAYPWRDNFCEHRHFYVGQCPAGQGHQGQDIRPSDCKYRNEGADRCEPYRHDVVAAREGMILRETWQEAVSLFVNTPGERIRFRYLHMNPGLLNADGVTSGRRVREGETIGKVGNYNRRSNGTTYHLHFETLVPTSDGWVRVNPYQTLVAAYEHLIQARGIEITPTDEEPADLSAASEATAAKAGKSKASKSKASKSKASKSKKKKPRHKRQRKRGR
jgi:murein DD-endopeptidase MepM/ murein hydrolase activator NlpD